MAAAGRAAFEAAVDAYDLEAVPLDETRLAPLREALVASEGLLLVGESHGVEQTPAVLHALIRALGIRRLALEWSDDELGDIVASGFESLWDLPPEAEAFSGDGRFTAGHVAAAEARPRSTSCVLLDRASSGEERSLELGERLLAARRPGVPLLAVLGASHAVAAKGTAASRLVQAVPGLRPVLLRWSGGRCWFHGERDLDGRLPEFPAELRCLVPVQRRCRNGKFPTPSGDGARLQPPPTADGSYDERSLAMPVVAAVALGGALGALARYGLDRFIEHHVVTVFPWSTFAINMTGCLLVGPGGRRARRCAPPSRVAPGRGGRRLPRRVHDVLDVRAGDARPRSTPGTSRSRS